MILLNTFSFVCLFFQSFSEMAPKATTKPPAKALLPDSRKPLERGSREGRAAQSAVASTSIRASRADPTADTMASRPNAPTPTVQQAVPSADARITTSPGLLSNECHLSPSLIRRLGICVGSLVRISTTVDAVVCEVLLGANVSGSSLGVAELTAAILVDSDCTVEPLLQRPPEGREIHATVLDCDDPSPAYESIVKRVSPLQLGALLRAVVRNRAVTKGMVFAVRVSGLSVRLEIANCLVVDAEAKSSSCPVVMALDSVNIVVASPKYAVPIAEGPQGTIMEGTQLPKCHTLLVGESGTGKSHCLRNWYAAARQQSDSGESKLHPMWVSIPSFLSVNSQGSVTNATALHELFREAKSFAPSIVFLDDIHLLCPSSTPSSGDMSAWGVLHTTAALLHELDGAHCLCSESSDPQVVVVASAPTLESVDSAVLSFHRLGRGIRTIDPPANGDGRAEVLLNVFAAECSEDGALAATLREVAEHAHGCTQGDLAQLKDIAAAAAFRRSGSARLTPSDIVTAAKSLRPSSLRNIETTIPSMSWNDIGGSAEAKKALQECVAWCLGKNKWVFEKFKLSPPKGVLLYGPPGCSKTMLAKALANESKMNFISVKGPEVFSKWVGDSEKAVREVFRKARAAAPCVVFIDELDGMCGHRGRGSGVSDRVISQFLTELDGLPAAMSDKTDSIVFVAATNRPENIDGAVLRPGRIDKKVYVGLPDVMERKAIAAIHLVKMPHEEDKITAEFAAERTEGYSGAEVVAVCKEAAFQALSRDFSAEKVTLDDFEKALQKVRPRISKADVDWYKRWAEGGH